MNECPSLQNQTSKPKKKLIWLSSNPYQNNWYIKNKEWQKNQTIRYIDQWTFSIYSHNHFPHNKHMKYIASRWMRWCTIYIMDYTVKKMMHLSCVNRDKSPIHSENI